VKSGSTADAIAIVLECDDRDGSLILVHEPGFAHAVFLEPFHALGRFANPRLRREHFDHEVGRAADTVVHDPRARIRHEKQIRWNNRREAIVQDDVERRQPDLAKLAAAQLPYLTSGRTRVSAPRLRVTARTPPLAAARRCRL